MKDRWLHINDIIASTVDVTTIGRRKRSFIIAMIQGFLILALTIATSATPTFGADVSPIPSYGKGPKELIVFTDYFCPPCMTMEADLEPAINKLLARGDVKVTFVDIPGHPPTAMYAKYFLFATQGAEGYKNVMHARNVLFSLSKQNLAKTEAEIEKAFTEKGVAFRTLSPKPIYAEWSKIIKQYRIKTTPTCVLKHSETDIVKYEGTVEIRKGLLPELEAMGKRK